MIAIYKKELRSYFTSMIGYVFIAFSLIIVGISFYNQNLIAGIANFEYTITDVTIVFILLVPILTMRLMAEEKKQKTDQLLLTTPLKAGDIVLGKFLAVFSVLLIVMAIVSLYPLIINIYGDVPFGAAYSSIFGFCLLGGAYLAIGIFISSLTDSQVVAAVVTLVTFIITSLIDAIGLIIPSDGKTAYIFFAIIIIAISLILYRMMNNVYLAIAIAAIGEIGLTIIYLLKPVFFDGLVVKVFGWISVLSRFKNFRLGILDISDIIYYLSVVFIFLFLTSQVIKKKRWS